MQRNVIFESLANCTFANQCVCVCVYMHVCLCVHVRNLSLHKSVTVRCVKVDSPSPNCGSPLETSRKSDLCIVYLFR